MIADTDVLHDFQADKTTKVSAFTGFGLYKVKIALEEILREDRRLITAILPYEHAGVIQMVRKYGELLEEEYQENGIFFKAFVP